MRYLIGVIGMPVAMWAACLGCGLACERLLRVRLSNALVLPLGLCAAFVIVYPGYAAGVGDWLAIALLAVATLAGLIFARGGLRARLNPGWAGVAGVGVYVLYMLPVIAYGHWTWSGYDFVNDTAFEMLLARHAKSAGLLVPKIADTSEDAFLINYLQSGYPLGTQTLLGTFSGLLRTDVAVLYQGFIASLAAMGAIALSTVARGLLNAPRAALVGFAAFAANLTYQYAFQGGIKEIGLLATIAAAVALGREAVGMDRRYRAAAMLAIAAAAALATYNAVAIPFLGALGLFFALAVLLRNRLRSSLRWVGPALVGGCMACVLAIPSLMTFSRFLEVARVGEGSTGVGATQFGQLVRRLPLSQISGVWLSGEYRFPVSGHLTGLLTAIATAVLLLALVPTFVWVLWRRDAGLMMLIGMAGLVMLIMFPRVSPYAQGKLLAMCSPAVVLVALAGMLCLRGRIAAPVGRAAASLLIVAILASDAFAYGHDRVAPTAQIEAIRETGDHFAGKGLVLWNEFEEYAKYFAAAARINAPFEAVTHEQVALRSSPGFYFYGHAFDLDEEELWFVERFPIIVTRRSPSASRPPANYRLVYENAYYEGWQREAHPVVLDHLPLQQVYSPSRAISCPELAPIVAKAPRGSKLMVATAPEESWFEATSESKRAAGWGADPNQAGAVETSTPGNDEGVLRVSRSGSYALWVQGDFPRAVYVEVDGRRVGSVSGSNTPGQWLQATSLWLLPGAYTVNVLKVGGHRHFGPGDWGIGTLGAVALQRQMPETVRAVALSHWRSLCGTSADWVEVVRP